jgi:hypothetical protein
MKTLLNWPFCHIIWSLLGVYCCALPCQDLETQCSADDQFASEHLPKGRTLQTSEAREVHPKTVTKYPHSDLNSPGEFRKRPFAGPSHQKQLPTNRQIVYLFRPSDLKSPTRLVWTCTLPNESYLLFTPRRRWEGTVICMGNMPLHILFPPRKRLPLVCLFVVQIFCAPLLTLCAKGHHLHLPQKFIMVCIKIVKYMIRVHDFCDFLVFGIIPHFTIFPTFVTRGDIYSSEFLWVQHQHQKQPKIQRN